MKCSALFQERTSCHYTEGKDNHFKQTCVSDLPQACQFTSDHNFTYVRFLDTQETLEDIFTTGYLTRAALWFQSISHSPSKYL